MVIIFSAKNNLTWIKFCAVKHIETGENYVFKT